nr:MAG TPA: hypothetical protein [Caudoviricetes sp.]
MLDVQKNPLDSYHIAIMVIIAHDPKKAVVNLFMILFR